MPESILYLTELTGLPVFDLKRRTLGRIKDAAIVPVLDPHRIDRFLIGSSYSWLAIRHDQIRHISLDGIFLADEQLTPYHADEYMLRLVRDLLDQQIIDAQGRKVVRVTDVTFHIVNTGGTVDFVDDPPLFPMRTWVRTTIYVNYHEGEMHIWQDGRELLHATFSRGDTDICQWHWGAYASGDNTDVVLFEDDNAIWKLDEPWTDFSVEPYFGVSVSACE